MGVFLKIEGEFLTIVSGINAKYLIAVMTVILVLELLYTVLGGMVAVVITDFIQYVLLSVATILRSEEHTSELQSPCNLVCRLLLEKKKNIRLLTACCTHVYVHVVS